MSCHVTCHVMSCHALICLLKQLPCSLVTIMVTQHGGSTISCYFYLENEKTGLNHVISSHVMSHYVMVQKALFMFNFNCTCDKYLLKHWFHLDLEEKHNIWPKSCHVMSCHVKTGSCHNFFKKFSSNPKRGH